jgi:hypothetical protein
LGIVTDVKFTQLKNAFVSIIVSVEVGVNVTDVKLEQPLNALAPILVTEFPIVTPVKTVRACGS